MVELEKNVTVEEVNKAVKEAAENELKGTEYSEVPLVSTDILNNPHSSIYDASSTQLIGENHLKLYVGMTMNGLFKQVVDLLAALFQMDNLPEAPKAIGNYTTIKQIGNLIYTSGHIPVTDTKNFIGKIPNEISMKKAKAASLCAQLTISTLTSSNIELDEITQINTVGFEFRRKLQRTCECVKWIY